MSAEFNKVLCVYFSNFSIILSSFIGELIYHPKVSDGKVSYL